jgi:hypothetical protein
MNSVVKVVGCAGLLALLVSCSLSSEGRGNRAYAESKKALSASDKRLKEKEAYMCYLDVMTHKGDRANLTVHTRFLELSINRAALFLEQAGMGSGQIKLMIADVDKYLNAETPAEVKTKYASLLERIADSVSASTKSC